MPKISIIVPIYNVEKYLPRCIDSILAQTFTDFELILVDDGSPDNCPQICDEYAKKDNRIKVIHKENGGVSSARNIGLDISNGKYLSFVDPDDIINTKYLDLLYNSIDDADFVYCEFIRFTDKCNFNELLNSEFDVYTKENVYNCIYFWSAINPIWNKLIKKETIGNLRFDNSLKNAEDTLFNFELLKRSHKVIHIRNELYGYFMRNDGAIGSLDFFGKKTLLRLIKEYIDLMR